MHLHQVLLKNYISRNCEPENLKFLGGSNIFKHNLFRYMLDWNINFFTMGLYRNSVSIGGGCERDPATVNWYTKHIYKTILSKDFVHSTRDSKTKAFLESLGFKAVNTGCPTMWSLTSAHCKLIPTTKAKDVVFTLTDYSRDQEKDQQLIDILVKNYKVVYFWLQGARDLEYFNSFNGTEHIKLVNPNLKSYQHILNRGHVDYVGTRLHAGIYAMQHKVRSIILAVDNRARDIKTDYNLNVIERGEIGQLEAMINSAFVTDVHIDEKRINLWKKQFEGANL
jgi:polysaccharide pyruvyl transferase WcaK-like protein